MAKILIIEDDPYVQRMYKRMFSHNHYDLILASKGDEGIELARKNNPDVILLDIMLPGKNGLEVLEDLKNSPETKKIPVIMLTNLGDEEVVRQAKNLGADFYMVKADFSPNEVLEMIEKYIKPPKIV